MEASVLLHADSVQTRGTRVLELIYQALITCWHRKTWQFSSLAPSLLSQDFIYVMAGQDHLKITVESYASKLSCWLLSLNAK